MEKTCENCAAYLPNGLVGECRIHAPRPECHAPPFVRDRMDAFWPVVCSDDWCLEWSPIPLDEGIGC